jgi:Tfp pilus assembly protein PilN
LQANLNKFKVYETTKKQLEKDEVSIKTKLETLRKLVLNRNSHVKVLLAISGIVPKDVWLTSLKIGQTDVSLKGESLGFSQVTDFLKNLSESALFSNLSLDNTKKKTNGTSAIAEFDVKVKRRQP